MPTDLPSKDTQPELDILGQEDVEITDEIDGSSTANDIQEDSQLLEAYMQVANGIISTTVQSTTTELEPGAPLESFDVLAGVGIGASQDVDALGDSGPGEPAVYLYTTEHMEKAEAVAYVLSAYGAEAFSKKDLPVQVVRTGPIDAYSHRSMMRPAPCGISCGHYSITAGTLGVLCTGLSAPREGRTLLLSNNHVLAAVNAGKIGDVILQPGQYDGGQNPQNMIGYLERYVPISFNRHNFVDCATAWVDPRLVRREFLYIKGGKPHFFRVSSSPKPARSGMLVGKSGRTTQLTAGRVVTPRTTIRVNMGGGRVATFVDQIGIQGIANTFSQGGDSGSLIWTWDESRDPIGLLFAGGGGFTFANPIGKVLSNLKIRLLT